MSCTLWLVELTSTVSVMKFKFNGVPVTNDKVNYSWIKSNGSNPSNAVMMVSQTNDFKSVLGITVKKAVGWELERMTVIIPDIVLQQIILKNREQPMKRIIALTMFPVNLFTVVLTSITSNESGELLPNYQSDNA